MVFTEEEIEILVNDEQTAKEYFSMIFTDDGFEIFTKDEHLFSGTFTDQQQKGYFQMEFHKNHTMKRTEYEVI